jgi:hypothetical protein
MSKREIANGKSRLSTNAKRAPKLQRLTILYSTMLWRERLQVPRSGPPGAERGLVDLGPASGLGLRDRGLGRAGELGWAAAPPLESGPAHDFNAWSANRSAAA